MPRDNDIVRTFTRRSLLIGGMKLALFGGLAGRLYWLQIIQGANYRTMAEENRINSRYIIPHRGQINDRFGVPLATNEQTYRLIMLPEQIDDAPRELLAKIADIVPVSDEERAHIEKSIRQSRINAVIVRNNLTWEQVAALSLRTSDLPGIDIESAELRAYPYGSTLAHVIGYVGPVNSNDLKNNNNPILSVPGLRLGRNGLEKIYDTQLRGEAGSVQLEVNARGRVVRELARHDPKAGQQLTLTLDIGLQEVAAQRLEKVGSGAAVVLDINTGAVRALVNSPNFDPNLFSGGILKKDWDILNNNERGPLNNKAISGLYAPGSTFKVVTALAAFESDVIKPEATVFCPGWYQLGDRKFHCWKKGGHGHVNFIQAMAGSCDTYFYEVGLRMGVDRLQSMGERMGLGARTGIDLPHERAGIMPGRAWKRARYNAQWHQGETLITAIGQGAVTSTPIQLAVIAAIIANGGYAVKPHMIEPKEGPHRGASLGLSQQSLDLVRKSMQAVVTEPWGTAYGARIMDADMAMAGKTGTSQVRRITMAERLTGVRSNDELPWRERDHALFMGFAPIKAPRFAISVVIEHGGSGAHAAAPLARDILLACQSRELHGEKSSINYPDQTDITQPDGQSSENEGD